MTVFYRLNGHGIEEPNVDSLEKFLVEFDVANEALEHSLEEVDDELAEAGFIDPLCYVIGRGDAVHMVQIVWRHESGNVLARMFTRFSDDAVSAEAQQQSSSENKLVDLITSFEDGSFLLTTASPSRTVGADGCSVNQFLGASLETLWQSHRRRMTADRRTPQLLETDDDVIEATERYHGLWRDSLVRSGEFVELADGEDDAVDAADSADHAVLSEMRRQSEKQSGSVMALLFISIVIFSAIGPAAWDMEFLALLIPIILFHEAGHFVAMKVFRYRNVKMFFIPFLGAAVTGRQYNVPGWKQVIVSLAGPLPGIMLGAVLLGVSLFWPHEFLKTAISQLVLINALNLLPILPLDGGWIAQTLVFSRHPVLAAAFKLVAILCLFATGILEGSFLFPIIGLTMLIGLPMGYKVERLGRQLRKEGLASPPDDDSIPDGTGLRIIRELRGVVPAATTPQTLATLALTAFERVNARPPGLLASVVFAGLQMAGLFFALVIAAIVNWPDMNQQFAEIRRINDAHSGDVECHGIQQQPDHRDAEGRRQLIVASYVDAHLASTRLAVVSREASPTCEFVVVGRAIIASELVSKADAVIQLKSGLTVDSLHCFEVQESFSGTLICEAPDLETAADIEAVLNRYFDSNPGSFLVPPWSPAFEVTPEQQRHRELLEEYQAMRFEALEDPRIQELWKELATEELEAPEDYQTRQRELMTRQQEILDEIIPEKRKSITDQFTTDSEWQVIAAFDECSRLASIEGDSPEYLAALAGLGKMLGQLPMNDGQPSATDQRYSCSTGSVIADELTLHVSFNDAFRGDWLLPTLADYLCDRDCQLTGYQITPTFEEHDLIDF